MNNYADALAVILTSIGGRAGGIEGRLVTRFIGKGRTLAGSYARGRAQGLRDAAEIIRRLAAFDGPMPGDD